MGKVDYKAELNTLRQRLATETSAELMQRAMECCVGVAEQNLAELRCSWENAALARELLVYARQLFADKISLSFVEQAIDEMADLLYAHPRLKLELMLLRLDILLSIGEVHDELDSEIALYKGNIEAADSGRVGDVKQTKMLKYDPIEWTARWEEVIDEAEKIVDSRLEDVPRGMGFCHAYWHEKAAVLSEQFGIEWRSPARMNPRVLFD